MARASTPRDMLRPLVTPEGAELHVRLGEAGTRAGAFLIDALLMLGIMIAGTVLAILTFLPHSGIGPQPTFIAWLILFFGLRNGYFILFESGRRAATWGKRLCRLRVVSRDGSALSVDQVIARNLMREIEVFLPLTILAARGGSGVADSLTTLLGLGWTLLFTFFPLMNRDRLRIGDLLAGTQVIVVPRQPLLPELSTGFDPVAGGYRFTAAQLDAYGIAELHKLEEVLRSTNEEALWVVARAIEAKIGWRAPLPDARPFLLAYYQALRAHLERGVLLGRRRADKWDVTRR